MEPEPRAACPQRAPQAGAGSAGGLLWLLLLPGRDLREYVAARQHEEVLAVDGDLGAAVLE
jgi:hypothetical protein